MRDLSGKKVLVVGAGQSGIAACRLLVQRGARVTLTDRKSAQECGEALSRLADLPLQLMLGRHEKVAFCSADLIVVSPGVPLTLEALVSAREAGVPVIGEVELAFPFLDAPLIAVTGTNGKSTTTTLLGEILTRKGYHVFVGGNLGPPLCQAVLSGDRFDWIVAEISSFQLETIQEFHPRIALLLNVTPDHLDRYRDFFEYCRAKARIFERQEEKDYALLNALDPVARAMATSVASRVFLFGGSLPCQDGVYVRGREVIFSSGHEEQPLFSLDDLALPGLHNVENAMAAGGAALLAGCGTEAIREGIKKFVGLEHRLEYVREIGGVIYVNDSKGTNVDATLRAVEGMTGPVILIAGGRDKGSDFTPLRHVASRIREVILIGEAKEKIRDALASLVRISETETLQEAVRLASERAARGDVVLLSPACASFDMFCDYEERGRVFKEAVNSLP